MTDGFWSRAELDPDKVALIDADGAETTAGELLAEANRVAHGLQALGLRRGDVVAVLLGNEREFFEVYLAATQIGLYFTAINWHLKPGEIGYIVQNSGAKALVVHERFANAAQAAVEEIGFPENARFSVGEAAGFCSFAEFKADEPDSLPPERSAGWIMLYTGGTTGRPKGVRRALMDTDPDTAAGMLALLGSMFGIEPGDGVHLVTGPLYHSAPLAFGGVMSLHLGHTIVLMDHWSAEDALERIERYRVTTSHLVPTMFHRLLALPEEVRGQRDVSSLRVVIHGAAPCPVEVKRRIIEWWGPVLVEYYAGTEGGGTSVRSQDWLERPGTVGLPMPGATVTILDDDGNECPPGVPGTIYMSSLVGGFEYHGDTEKTAAAHRGNVFTLGDVGYLDEDGYLFLCDRKIDMIISGGVNIYPAEIEGELLAHPSVGDAVVIGVPSDDWGEDVKAVVEPADGVEGSPELEQELIGFLRERIAHYKCPRTIDFRKSLPRNEMGKLAKRLVRDEYWRGRERTI